MKEIKQKLLKTNIVKDNEYLSKYCELIYSNKDTTHKIHKTQKHHIIPRYYFKDVDLSLDKDKDNIVNLLYKDHILAHYYLALCSTTAYYQAKNVSAIFKMSNCTQTNSDIAPLDFFKSLDKYQELYEIHAKHQGDHLRGKKQSPEHIAQRVHKNTGKKRTLESRKKMSVWQKGKPKSEAARENMRKARLAYAMIETEEHKKARVAKANETKANRSPEYKKELSIKLSNSLKGRPLGEQECLNKSLAMSGKPKSESHKISLSRSRSKYRYYIDGNIFESYKEAKSYLIDKTGLEFSHYKWTMILNCDGIINDILITKELKTKL